MTYPGLVAMIAASIVATHAMMYLNTYSLDYVFCSPARAWMALCMGAGMAMIMLDIYRRRPLNIAIILVTKLVFAEPVHLLRSQRTDYDVA